MTIQSEAVQSMRLADKRAIVTGAGSGIGRAAVRLFAAEGARVLAVGRTASTLAAACEDAGGSAEAFAADLADSAAAEAAAARAVALWGGVDILVHAAGVGYSWTERSPGSMEAAHATSPDKWREVIAINLDACFHICRAVLAPMRAQRTGAIVNVASISGMLGLPAAHAYTAAKAGVINFTRSLCVAYASDGIRANCLAPGFVDTPMVASVVNLFDDPERAAAITPMARPGRPEEMAEACLFLASDACAYINGHVLVADGGQSARQ